MKNIKISEELADKCPDLFLSCIECNVRVELFREDLWQLIEAKCREIASKLEVENIRHIEAIASSREAYKACGKDPARYRLSAEALLRRVVSGKGLYQINNVVDTLNFVSIHSGLSIGGYDADKIQGNVVMGIGKADEPYEGLGRGTLNIEGMPVFRDQRGAFGTPTSDSERTGVGPDTKRFLMILVSYQGGHILYESSQIAVKLLSDYASASHLETYQITV
ncbi:B3/B4 domain-containing protein [Mangrovibacterium lignilyticum]|uniref:B3/B4 domain-containing protein n=1 Tax=Mangrovibacterium lignilyticum TaxID=2668052 RepID=UPI0013D8175F|nr:phenylalanine--tRNA ligase beta subunit-related protein [Mangrovibacterium lignilyticum]